MKISDRIDIILKNSKLTVKEFVKKIEVTEQTYYNYASGRSKPSSDILEKIVLVFGVDAYWLLTGENLKKEGINNVNQIVGNNLAQGNNNIEQKISIGNCEKELEHLRELLLEKDKQLKDKEHIISLLSNKT